MTTFRIQIVSALLLAILYIGETALGDVNVIDLGGDQFMAQFAFDAPADAKSVNLAGTFNQWNPNALRMDADENGKGYTAELTLKRGRYEYKFVLNGSKWFADPDNPTRTGPNKNSVLVLGEEPARSAVESGPAAKMPGQMEHPQALLDAISRPKDCASGMSGLELWTYMEPMPSFTESTVTFMIRAPIDHAAWLEIVAPNSRFGYELEKLRPNAVERDARIKGITLEREKIPEHAVYYFNFSNGGESRRVIDPFAWSVTSRAGKPAGRIVEPSPDTGRIQLIENLGSLDESLRRRDIYIYFPPGYGQHGLPPYGADTTSRYPVVYLHDGQNCWDDPAEPFGHGGWAINQIADKLINAGEVKPFIAVGIANTPDRLKEYGPGDNIFSADSHAYLQFIAKTLKPIIDEKYRTQPGPEHTSLMGSSMGGAISFQGALLMPDVFGSAACLSTAFLFNDANDKGYTELVNHRGKQPVRLYLDSGTGGKHQDGAPATRAMVELLKETGWQIGNDLVHFEDKGADHNERAWRARVDRPLRFLFAAD